MYFKAADSEGCRQCGLRAVREVCIAGSSSKSCGQCAGSVRAVRAVGLPAVRAVGSKDCGQ